MKNILNPSDLQNVIDRIRKVSPTDKAQWGKMNVNQMVCHLTDQFKMMYGEIQAKKVGGFFQRTFLKWLVLVGVPAPKGKVKTLAEIDQIGSQFAGSIPLEIQNDKLILISYINRFANTEEDQFKSHPIFGHLSKKQWGRLAYLHLEHHLTQFGR